MIGGLLPRAFRVQINILEFCFQAVSSLFYSIGCFQCLMFIQHNLKGEKHIIEVIYTSRTALPM